MDEFREFIYLLLPWWWGEVNWITDGSFPRLSYSLLPRGFGFT